MPDSVGLRFIHAYMPVLLRSTSREAGCVHRDESFLPYDVFDIDGDSNTTERLPDLFLLLRVVNGGGGLAPDIAARENQ